MEQFVAKLISLALVMVIFVLLFTEDRQTHRWAIVGAVVIVVVAAIIAAVHGFA